MSQVEFKSSKNIPSLTAMRFFAAFGVIAFHMSHIIPYQRISVLSHGVSFFFVLSGFILTHSYGRDIKMKSFFINRLARIWPLHILTGLLAVALLDVTALKLQHTGAIAVANIGLIQSWIPIVGVPFSFNAPSWSISTEWFFYLLFPLLVMPRSLKIVYPLLIVGVFITLLILSISDPMGKPRPFDFYPFHLITQHPLMRVMEFCTGIIAAFVVNRYKKQIKLGSLAEVLTLIGLLGVLMFFEYGDLSPKAMGSLYVSKWISESGAMHFYAILIAVFAMSDGVVTKILSCRIFVLLGKISFATYLLHQIVIKWFKEEDLGLIWWHEVIAIMVITYIGSYFLWRFVEEPSRRGIVRLSKMRNEKPTMTVSESKH